MEPGTFHGEDGAVRGWVNLLFVVFKITFVYLFVAVMGHVEARGQLPGVSFLFSPSGPQGSISGYQA